MFCAISGEPPQHPVISAKSGHLYEKRLILKYLSENASKDPITGDELDAERDLIEVKADPKVAAPRPPQYTSIPSMLSSLQNEYDSIIFEMLTLKKQYDSARQELASALYANDAANRVIARLLKELDEAREALASIGGSLGAGVAVPPQQDADMADAEGAAAGALPADVLADIDATAARLSAQRKPKSKRKPPPGYATAETAASFGQTQALPSMHASKPPGVTALALSANAALALTGGADKQVQIYDRAADQVVATLKGHTKAVTSVLFEPPTDIEVGDAAAALPAPRFAVSASEDKTVRIWREADGGKWACAHILKGFSGTPAIALHPNGKLLAVAAAGSTSWAVYDVASGKDLVSVDAPAAGAEAEEEADGGYSYTSIAFHPDGQLLATGTADGAIRIWDVKSAAKVTTFRGAHRTASSAVTALGFSENGYYLAAGARSSPLVEVWDLRKQTVAGTIEYAPADASASVAAVVFDPSAQLLAVVGTDVKVYANKSWALLATFDGNASELTGAAWDAKDGSLAVAGLDRTLRTIGAPA